MNAEEQKSEELSISDRKSILLIDNDSLPSDASRGVEEIDLSILEDREFDALVDRIIGYKYLSKIESTRKDQPLLSKQGEAKWSKKSPVDGYSSSYRDIKEILKVSGMKDGDSFVDIGSSFGRVGCVIGANFPNTQFSGYEIVPERVAEAQRIADFLQLDNVNYFHADVSADHFEIPEADWFFFCDPLDGDELAYTLQKIHNRVSNKEVRLIAKYTGGLNKYAKSPYLEFISKTGKEGTIGECWFYRFKNAS